MNLGYAYLAYWGTFAVVLWVGPGLLAAVGPEGPVKGIRMVDEDRWQEWQARAERAEARVAELEAAVPLTAEQAKDPELISRVAAVIRDGPWIDRDTPGEMARDVLASLSPTGGDDE